MIKINIKRPHVPRCNMGIEPFNLRFACNYDNHMTYTWTNVTHGNLMLNTHTPFRMRLNCVVYDWNRLCMLFPIWFKSNLVPVHFSIIWLIYMAKRQRGGAAAEGSQPPFPLNDLPRSPAYPPHTNYCFLYLENTTQRENNPKVWRKPGGIF